MTWHTNLILTIDTDTDAFKMRCKKNFMHRMAAKQSCEKKKKMIVFFLLCTLVKVFVQIFVLRFDRPLLLDENTINYFVNNVL
jgi:hypothetical protein